MQSSEPDTLVITSKTYFFEVSEPTFKSLKVDPHKCLKHKLVN